MDDVKVEYNSFKPVKLGALAYTQATDIHVGPGQERHLAHEAWHVAQQKQGRVRPTAYLRGAAINDDSSLEREAETMGARANAVPSRAGQNVRAHAGSSLSSAAPIQMISKKDLDAALTPLRSFKLGADAEDFWYETIAKPAGQGEASEVYNILLTTGQEITNDAELRDALACLSDHDEITRDHVAAFVAVVNQYRPGAAMESPFMALFSAEQGVEEEENATGGRAVEVLAQELAKPLRTLVAMKATDAAGDTAAEVVVTISNRVGDIAFAALNHGDETAVAQFCALRRSKFIERLLNILVLQDSDRVLCHETEIARPLLSTLRIISSKVKSNAGIEVPVEADLSQRAMKLFRRQFKTRGK